VLAPRRLSIRRLWQTRNLMFLPHEQVVYLNCPTKTKRTSGEKTGQGLISYVLAETLTVRDFRFARLTIFGSLQVADAHQQAFHQYSCGAIFTLSASLSAFVFSSSMHSISVLLEDVEAYVRQFTQECRVQGTQFIGRPVDCPTLK
jgi:hypothetical protein